jgi:hypothetical protein
MTAGANNMNFLGEQGAYEFWGAVVGRAISAAARALVAARAAKAAAGAVDLTNIPEKIAKQMVKRGWTTQGITDTIQQAEEAGTAYTMPNNYTGGTATEYVNRSKANL